MVIVGFLGAFTTFSTFEVEIFGLMREKQLVVAFLYLALSILVGFAGVLVGVAIISTPTAYRNDQPSMRVWT